VTDDIVKTFQGKSSAELSKLRDQVQAKINSGGPGVDIEFWDGVLKKLEVHRAKAFLRETHQELLKQVTKQLSNSLNYQLDITMPSPSVLMFLSLTTETHSIGTERKGEVG